MYENPPKNTRQPARIMRVRLDIFGGEHREMLDACDTLPGRHRIVHHGPVDHDRCLEAIETADVGYCVLLPRPDWKYAHPIKVGEALAGGAIPLVSRFPGMADVAGHASWYVEPTADATADAIERLAALSPSDYQKHARAARDRAEQIARTRMRREWLTEVSMALDCAGS